VSEAISDLTAKTNAGRSHPDDFLKRGKVSAVLRPTTRPPGSGGETKDPGPGTVSRIRATWYCWRSHREEAAWKGSLVRHTLTIDPESGPGCSTCRPEQLIWSCNSRFP
jgi:hypothetical protein